MRTRSRTSSVIVALAALGLASVLCVACGNNASQGATKVETPPPAERERPRAGSGEGSGGELPEATEPSEDGDW